MMPVPFWLYYFNIDNIDAAAQRVTAGGGQILDGPLEVPGGSWIVQCADPQGAIFALEGKRGRSLSDISSASHRAIVPARRAGDGPGKAGRWCRRATRWTWR